uniref:G-protein coupled receptors family 1 profile domain-containing protein n=1 Tax=Plectus sambesii TaxID=2011161 RepID=A0A914WBV2_9BILA
MDAVYLPNCTTRRALDAEYKTFSIAVNGLLTTAFVVLGTLGNLSSMKFVRIANFDKNRGVVLAVSLMALAIWDTLLLWCAFFYYSLKSITQALNVEQRFDILTLSFHPAIQIANTASVWCVVVITVQRYVASKDPFSTGRGRLSLIGNPTLMATFRRERRASSIGVYWSIYRRHFRMPLILSTLAVLMNIPAFFELMMISCLKRDTG